MSANAKRRRDRWTRRPNEGHLERLVDRQRPRLRTIAAGCTCGEAGQQVFIDPDCPAHGGRQSA